MKIDLNDVVEDSEEVANLEEFMGLLLNGMSTEQAVQQVWPTAQPQRYASDVNGTLIGWDMCGGCGKHVSRCTEPGGPTEPAYFGRLREEDARRKAIAAGENPAVARTSVASGSRSSGAPSEQGSSTSAAPEEGSSTSSGSSMVPCGAGQHLVPADEAERNDDGTWTCFEHQASAAVRPGGGNE